MFALALLARLGSAAALFRQGGDLPRVPLQRVGLRALASRLRGTPRVPVLGFLVAAIAGAAICGPFLTPFLLVHDQIGYASYSVFTATVVIVKIAALPVLGRLIQRVGVKRVLAVSAIAIAPIPLLWPVSRSLAWLLAAQAYCGLAWAGFDLGMLISLFDGADDAERTTTQVAFSALQAMGTAGASLAGGALLISFGGHQRGVRPRVRGVGDRAPGRGGAARAPPAARARAPAAHRHDARVDARDPAVGRHARPADRRHARALARRLALIGQAVVGCSTAASSAAVRSGVISWYAGSRIICRNAARLG